MSMTIAQRAQQALLAGNRVEALALAHAAVKSWAMADLSAIADIATVAGVFSHCDRPDLAMPLFGRASAMAPGHPGLLFNLATAQRACGALAEAEATIGRLLAINPADGEAHYLRVSLRRQRPGEPGQAMMETALASAPDAITPSRVALHFALAKALDDQDEFARAFAHFQAGNTMRRRAMRYDPADDLAVMTALGADAPQPATQAGPATGGPIFILGLPRSGTTLVERVLSAHSDVTAGGELEAFPQAVVSLTGPVSSRQEFVARSRQVPPADLARRYRDLVAARSGATPWFTDKLPLNGLYLGLIRAAFPAAPVIVLERDAMANGFAMYSTLFAQAYPFSYDLAETGRYMAGWRGLMRQWQDRFGDSIHPVGYEAFVHSPEDRIGEILRYCGLPWQAACLAPHQSAQPVSSASAVQVRQPIHTRSAGRWKHYEPWLSPLAEALARAG